MTERRGHPLTLVRWPTIALTLVTVHWYRREIEYIPGGHTAGLAVHGTGLDSLAAQLDLLGDDESLYLAVA